MRTARFRHASASFPLKFPWVGILLLLVLFGHHALRATETTAGHVGLPGQASSLSAMMDHAGHEAIETDAAPTTGDRHPSRPDIDCGVNSPAATIQASGSVTQIFPPSMVDSELPDLHGFGGGSAFEPIAPPGVRRALLQVYRI